MSVILLEHHIQYIYCIITNYLLVYAPGEFPSTPLTVVINVSFSAFSPAHLISPQLNLWYLFQPLHTQIQTISIFSTWSKELCPEFIRFISDLFTLWLLASDLPICENILITLVLLSYQTPTATILWPLVLSGERNLTCSLSSAYNF